MRYQKQRFFPDLRSEFKITNMKFFFTAVFTFLFFQFSFSQTTRKVCFIGNSYVYTNDLPAMISQMALADGNTLIKDQNTPGGYTFESHTLNNTSLTKIAGNTWDFVVLQEQSQMPSFPWSQVSTDVLPFAEILCDSVRAANACAIPLFFDTWGRETGDPQWDSIDTFTEMNQRLYNAYEYMADANSGMLAPVGIAFEHIANDVAPLVSFNALYSGDGSHPTIYGTFLAACVFYQQIFEENVVGNAFLPLGILATEAMYLQNVANHVLTAVDSIETSFIQPVASFNHTITGNDVSFTSTSQHTFEWNWDFGDGFTSSDENPTHTYSSPGTYTVQLITSYCGNADTIETDITISALSVQEEKQNQLLVYPNPSTNGTIFISVYEATDLTIYTTDGKLVYSDFINGKIELNLSPGTYLLKTKTSSQLLLVL
ncbi:MAG: PKD domain-containing protein [Crocinitomicaceae bacterium]|nr:PKD domain-containing protein [Crocinitomicaceae bacterium]